MSTYAEKPMSLVERKKQQWAKEREELAGLCAPWGPTESISYERPLGRTRYDSKFSMVSDYPRSDCKENSRRPSLPPLYKNQYNSNDRYEREREMGGETSGYGSDNPNQTPEHYKPTPWNSQSGYESSSSFRDDRPKWGDKGVATGKFWQAKEETSTNEPPNWVKRGLKDGEIVVSNSSPAESPEQTLEDHDRPNTGSSVSQNRTYIRGQNVRLDSTELAERERRRQIAMAHQEAIRQQLEERERKRREEREKRIKEEREEELRIEREQEVERQRKEQEERVLREKLEREQRRKEAIQEALEIAEKEAKLEKMKLRMMKQSNNVNITENFVDKEKLCTALEEIHLNNEKNDVVENTSEEKKNNNDSQNIVLNNTIPETIHNEINNNVEVIPKTLNNSSDLVVEGISLSPRDNSNNQSNNNTNATNMIRSPEPTPRNDSLALIFQTPLETLQNMQYAVIMSNVGGMASAIPIAVPITIANNGTTINTNPTPRTENRILTPTQYRNNNRKLCDSSTQTEYIEFSRAQTADSRDKYPREKVNNLELAYERSRKGRRSRNEDRRSESMEERPKWGANRPPTRYLKQSEKDPLYQRRKLRQKMRDSKSYDDKNSSDESQTCTPRSYRKKGYIEKRQSRAQWRKNDQLFSRNVRMYHTEIVPLETDSGHIYYKTKQDHDCCCRCKCDRYKQPSDNIKVDILKIEHNSPRESLHYKSEVIHRSDRTSDCNHTDREVLEKLSNLHNNLLSKQEQWESSPRMPALYRHDK